MKNKDTILHREQQELARLRRKSESPFTAKHLLIAILIIILVNVVDEVATNVRTSVQSSFVKEFFITIPGLTYSDELYQSGLSTHSLFSTLFILLIFFSPFYKSFADKLGRKPFFFISAAGLALGLIVCGIAPNYTVFIISFGILSFFVGHDMQIVYILEVAPKERRATIYSLAKCIGILGMVLIPILRAIFMANDDSQWRNVFLFPGFVGVVAAILVIFLIKESPVFLNQRIKTLSTPLEERLKIAETEKKEKKAAKTKGGVLNALKYIFSHKELRWLAIGALCYYFASMAFANYYESIMMLGGMSTNQITDALFVYPFVYCVLCMGGGILADKLGRKKVIIIGAVMALSCFGLFVFGANNGWNPYIVGALYGLYMGGYWIGGDYITIMLSEKVPTEIRASVIGSTVFFVYGSGLIGYILTMVGMSFAPLWIVCITLALPVLAATIAIIAIKIKETNGADMRTVGYENEQ